jgi:uncharacterized protein HemX
MELEKTEQNKKEGSFGAMVGSIIIILIILAGGLYFTESLRQKMIANQIEKSNEQEIAEMEAELEEENFDEIDSQLLEIEAELEASIEE